MLKAKIIKTIAAQSTGTQKNCPILLIEKMAIAAVKFNTERCLGVIEKIFNLSVVGLTGTTIKNISIEIWQIANIKK